MDWLKLLNIATINNSLIHSVNIRHTLNDFETVNDICSNLNFSTFHVNDAALEKAQNKKVFLIDKEHGYFFDAEYVQWNMDISSVYGLKLNFTTCYVKIQLCPNKTMLTQNEYVLLENTSESSVVLKKTGKLLSQNEFIILADGKLIACVTEKPEIALYVITLTGTCLSVTSLVATFSIYLWKSNLRTIPGKMTMNYIVALVLAQILLQSNDDFVAYPGVCKAIGALQHYFWLTTFTWLNCMAYRMYKTFANDQFTQHRLQRGCCDLIKFGIHGWLSPLCIVLPCLCLDLVDTGWFKYGDIDICWISNTQSNSVLYAFACPVLFLVSTNTILLICSALSLRRTFQAVNQVHKISRRQIFRIYLGLFTLMGTTWLIGFLPNLTGIDIFWYPFVILNAFQGVFVFCVFGLPNIMCQFKSNSEDIRRTDSRSMHSGRY